MQNVKNCKTCKHFYADPEQEDVFGDCRKNAPVPMPQEIAGAQPGYRRTLYMGTWPQVFGDDVCSQYWPFPLLVDELMRPAAALDENSLADAEVLRGSTKAAGDARSIPAEDVDRMVANICAKIDINALSDRCTEMVLAGIDKHFDNQVEQLVDINRRVDALKALVANREAKQ